MSPQEAISVMKSRETEFRGLKWQAHCTQARRASDEVYDSGPPNMLEPLDYRAEVALDVIGGRYLVRADSTCKWIRGAAPFLSTVAVQSFDGELYREVSWSNHSLTLPVPGETPGMGTISRAKEHLGFLTTPGTTALETQGLPLGLAYMPPFFWPVGTRCPPQRLSKIMRSWLDEGRDVAVVEDDTGTWSIIVCADTLSGNIRKWGVEPGTLGYNHLLQITYDPAKRGVVTGVKLLASDKRGEFTSEDVCIELDVREVTGGFWVPKTIKEVWPPDKLMTVTSVEGVEVNPPVDAGTFRLEFPKSVHVTNYVEKMYYITGDALDREAAMQAFLDRTNYE
jgi:hypothetical protein